MALPRYPRLTAAQLNRATLSRQLLLERADLTPVQAIARVGGLQAQEPASPYIALWSRLHHFVPSDLDSAFRERAIIKATLMRITVHAVAREDYRHFLSAVLPMLRRARRGRVAEPDGLDVDATAERVLEHARTPRTNSELRDLAGTISGHPGDVVWWRVRRHAPFVHVPGDVAWSFGRRPVLVSGPAWMGGADFPSHEDGLRRMVQRYLAAFGPATPADIANWSGLGVTSLGTAVSQLDAGGHLCRFEDEAGRELLDLPSGIVPEGDPPAPPRLLPMWDSVLLAYADRRRVIPDQYRPRVIMKNGDVLPTFLVGGEVAGLWWVGDGRRFLLEPFGAIPARVSEELEALGQELLRFVDPYEPEVYRRYRWDRARKRPG